MIIKSLPLLVSVFLKLKYVPLTVAFPTMCAISAYQHWRCEFESRSWQGVLDTTLCDQVCQWLGLWFSPGTLVSSTNKTDPHDITDILLKMHIQIYIIHKIHILTIRDPKS
jgi:hypothetical protein